jgi:tyrosinase
MTPAPRVFRSVAIPAGAERLRGDEHADIVVTGLEQAGASFELRIFLNNPRADEHTDTSDEQGYAGSIYVYGYGQPPEGTSAEPHPRPRLPMTRRINVTDAIRAAAAKGPEMTVALVPAGFRGASPDVDLGELDVSVFVHE